MKKYLAVFLLATAMHAQTAKVIALNPKDAIEAKSLHDQQEALKVKQAAFDDHILKTYLVKSEGKDPACNGFHGLFQCTTYRDGWGFGSFLYSDDFEYIVPQPQPPAPAWKNNECPLLAPADVFTGASHAN